MVLNSTSGGNDGILIVLYHHHHTIEYKPGLYYIVVTSVTSQLVD